MTVARELARYKLDLAGVMAGDYTFLRARKQKDLMGNRTFVHH
jgi:hypothetical protein